MRKWKRREEKKNNKTKQNKQTGWDVAPVENDHWQNFYNARAGRGEANERERTIRTYPIRDRPTDVHVSIVFLLHVPFSLLFLAELPRTCLDWHRRGGELPCLLSTPCVRRSILLRFLPASIRHPVDGMPLRAEIIDRLVARSIVKVRKWNSIRGEFVMFFCRILQNISRYAKIQSIINDSLYCTMMGKIETHASRG